MADKDFFDAIERKIDAIHTPDMLVTFKAQVLDQLGNMKKFAQDQMTSLEPLMDPPATLPQMVLWAKAVIDTYVKPFQTLLAKIDLYTERIARIETKLAAKASELSGGK